MFSHEERVKAVKRYVEKILSVSNQQKELG